MQKVIFSMLVFGLSVLGLASCGGGEVHDQESLRYVKSYTVVPAISNENYVYNGVVKEFRDVNLGFRVGGVVDQLRVKEGQFVNEGQIVAVIDQRDYLVKFQAAKAAFNQSKAEYDRYKELYERKKLPANTLEKLETGHLVAKSNFEQIKNALEDTELKAPFSGYVHKITIEEHETVGPGMPVFTLIDLNKMEVVINIPETHVALVNEVNQVNCDIKNASLLKIPASIKSVSKKGGAGHLYEVTLLLSGDYLKAVQPGMVAKVSMAKQFDNDMKLLLPVESVFEKASEQYVWVIEGQSNRVTLQAVKTGKLSGNGKIEVIKGVSKGDVVVTAGVHSLLEHQEVKTMLQEDVNIGEVL